MTTTKFQVKPTYSAAESVDIRKAAQDLGFADADTAEVSALVSRINAAVDANSAPSSTGPVAPPQRANLPQASKGFMNIISAEPVTNPTKGEPYLIVNANIKLANSEEPVKTEQLIISMALAEIFKTRNNELVEGGYYQCGFTHNIQNQTTWTDKQGNLQWHSNTGLALRNATSINESTYLTMIGGTPEEVAAQVLAKKATREHFKGLLDIIKDSEMTENERVALLGGSAFNGLMG